MVKYHLAINMNGNPGNATLINLGSIKLSEKDCVSYHFVYTKSTEEDYLQTESRLVVA